MSEFFDQPLGFYVVGLPLMVCCVAIGLMLLVTALVVIVSTVAWVLQALGVLR